MCEAPDLERHWMHVGGRLGATACMVVLLLVCANAANATDKPQAYEISAGFDAAPQSLYWYSEGITALNGDVAKDGFLLRTYGSLAVYQYATNAVAGIVDGELWQLDLMSGYQFVRGSVIVGGYVGLDYQQSQLSPDDPTNPLNGTATGVKVEAHYYYSDDKKPFEGGLVGEYSTAFDTYYAEARIGARIAGQFFMGPDVSVDGDTGYDAQRLGGYARYAFDLSKGVPLSVTVIAGHQFVSGGGSGFGGGAGTFGTLQLDTNF